MKKIFTLIALIMALFCVNCYAQDTDIQGMTDLLSELEIMVGDSDGNMRLDDYVSRAEFTKLAVASSKYKNTVASGTRISPFKDVPYTLWAAPYIKAGVDAGLCKGYVDSTFRPGETVTFEEAVTIMLRVLGYSDDDFGISWPYGQVGLGENLEITDGVNSYIGDNMTRRDVAVLVYNSLMTKMKDSQSDLLTVFDCELLEDIVICATNKEDISLGADKVATNKGTFKKSHNYSDEYTGRKGDAVIKDGDKLLSFTPAQQSLKSYTVTDVIGQDMLFDGDILSLGDNFSIYYKSNAGTYSSLTALAEEGDTFKLFFDENGNKEYGLLIPASGGVDVNGLSKYVIYSKLDNVVIVYNNGSFEQIDISDGTKAYKDKNQTTYAAVKSEMGMGDILYVKRTGSGAIDYVSYDKGTIDGPYTVEGTGWMSRFDTEQNTSIMRDGIKVSADKIQSYDIVYYSKELNMILAYSDKVRGVYENAIPNKDNPTSITVSGVTYNVESAAAFDKLSSGGSLSYGDTITIMLGRNGGVADVMTTGSVMSNENVTGYLVSTDKKSYTSGAVEAYSGYSAKLVLPDGSEREYIVDRDYKNYKNRVVSVAFTDGIGKISTYRNGYSSGGYVNYSSMTMGSNPLSESINILEVYTTDSDGVTKYAKVFPQRLDGVTVSDSAVLYMDKNAKGETENLIIRNQTGDLFEYGMMLSARNTDSSGSYTYDINGTTYNYSSQNQVFGVGTGRPVKMLREGNSISYMTNLKELGRVSTITYTEISVSGTRYKLADKAVVYKKSSDTAYSIIPLSDVIDNKIYKLTAYSDSMVSNGERVRVIIAE